MTVYPTAKINIGLSIIEKRNDGFHNIETVFYPVALSDTLHIEAAGADAAEKSDFACYGSELSNDNPDNNLCSKAYRLLHADYDLPPVKIRLHKTIPIGAGLGGGSADAAYTLQALNDLFRLRITETKLRRYASRLGSDCAFFLQKEPALGTGKGDVLTPIALSLAEYCILLVKPPVFVSTADAYSSVVPKKPQKPLSELLQAPVEEWRRVVFNDFEDSVFAKFPEIGQIKEKMYAAGAVYASMSGSGSSVYGLFRQIPENVDTLFPGCFIWKATI